MKSALRKAEKPADDSHILYAADKDTSIPREVFLDFLQTAVKMLLDADNQREMVLESCAQEIGLDRVAVEFQRDVLEYNFHMERNFACKQLANLTELYPGKAIA